MRVGLVSLDPRGETRIRTEASESCESFAPKHIPSKSTRKQQDLGRLPALCLYIDLALSVLFPTKYGLLFRVQHLLNILHANSRSIILDGHHLFS